MKHDFMKSLLQRKNWNKSSLLFFAGILGIFLILAGNMMPTNSEKSDPKAEDSAEVSVTAYACQLEQKLTTLLSQIQGVGKTQVAVTMDSSAQTVYALDEKSQEGSGSQETEHILLSHQNGQTALVEMVWEPEVRGIAVVCEGAEDITVRTQVTEAICVLTGVSSNRISIAKMN